jgi:hypothetical protein
LSLESAMIAPTSFVDSTLPPLRGPVCSIRDARCVNPPTQPSAVVARRSLAADLAEIQVRRVKGVRIAAHAGRQRNPHLKGNAVSPIERSHNDVRCDSVRPDSRLGTHHLSGYKPEIITGQR